MRKLYPIIHVCTMLLLPASVSLAQPLSWDLCRQLALKNNDVRAAKAKEAAATADLDFAKADQGSRVGVFLEHSQTDLPVVPESPEITHNTNFGIMWEQNLWQFFRGDAFVRLKEEQLHLSRITSEQTLADTLADAQVLYVRLIYLQQREHILQVNRKRLNENRQLVQSKYEGGLENIGSVKLAQYFFAEAELELQNTREQLHAARQDLSSLLQSDIQSYDIPLAYDSTLARLSSYRADQNLRMQQARAKRDISRWEETLEEHKFGPEIYLQARFGALSPFEYRRQEDWNITLGLKWYLFDNGRKDAAIRSRTQLVSAKEWNVQSVADKNERTLRTVKQSLGEREKAMALNDKFIDAAILRSDIERRRYNSGLASFDEWMRAESDWLQSARKKIDLQHDLQLAQIELVKAEGYN